MLHLLRSASGHSHPHSCRPETGRSTSSSGQGEVQGARRAPVLERDTARAQVTPLGFWCLIRVQAQRRAALMQTTSDDTPIAYMERTRRYYRALGYDTDYVWARFDGVPFTALAKPLASATVAVITTAGPPDRSNRDERGAKLVWSGSVDAPPATFETDVAWDRESTHVDDRETFLPLEAVRSAVATRRVGALAARFHGVPTAYSQRQTIERDAPEILRRLREDGADVALLTALCPVCHQTQSLVARHLEANGIPTVLVGSARDVVEHCGVPRFVFSDFPLGNPCGHPWDGQMQAAIVATALEQLTRARTPRSTVQTPFDWKPDTDWRARYGRVRPEDRDRLLALGDARRAERGQPPRAGMDRTQR